MFNKQQVKILEEFQEKIKTIKVYSFDEEDENKYSSETHAQLDQLESLSQNKPVYYIGSNCTEKKPPKTKSGEIALFNKSTKEWDVIKDFKGKEYYDVQTKQIEKIKTHKNNNDYIILTEKDKEEISSGKSVKIEKGKYIFYFTDEKLIQNIINKANSTLYQTDFYFYKDYPAEKVPQSMAEYREYLRTINSEKNLKGKDVQKMEVLTFEEYSKNNTKQG